MKKVLIITYYWPPCGGAGVQRWLKFVKYLPQFGWEPVVYTPENPEMPAVDHSLLSEIPDNITVLKTPIWEPYDIYKKFVGRRKDEAINPAFLSENRKSGLAEKISVWLRGNFFIPDARKFWIKPSMKFLSGYLKENPVNCIISSGPPHSMHLIALRVKKQFGIPWLTDFRDLWTKSDYHDHLMLLAAAKAKHRNLERLVLETADRIIAVGPTMKADLESAGGKNVEVITNGFDDEDITAGKPVLDKKFSLAHIGTLVKTRNPAGLWKTLAELAGENPQFEQALQIKLIGKVDVEVDGSIDVFNLRKYVVKLNYMPHHDVIREQQKSQVLLLLINQTRNAKGIVTGKFFEYLAAQRPVLAVGPTDGDVARILAETDTGKISDFRDTGNLKKNIREYFELFLQNRLTVRSRNLENFSRFKLTGKLVNILDNYAGKNVSVHD